MNENMVTLTKAEFESLLHDSIWFNTLKNCLFNSAELGYNGLRFDETEDIMKILFPIEFEKKHEELVNKKKESADVD